MATTVRVWAGMDGNNKTRGLTNLGGWRPEVVLFDERGDYLARAASKGHIPEGNFRDFVVKPKEKNNVRAAYVQLNACK